MQQLSIHKQVRDNVLIVYLCGQLDAMTSDLFSKEVDLNTNRGVKCAVLDMTDITLVDSSGIGVIVSLLKQTRAKGGDTVIANLRSQPFEVFKILNLDRLIKIFASVADAQEDCQKKSI